MASGIEWLSTGVLEVGAAEESLPLPDGYGMAGYSLGGKRGRPGAQSLYARAMALRDSEGNEATLVVADLMCASLALFEAVAQASGVSRESLILAGTHTHSAPGHFFANSFYRAFAQPLTLEALLRPDLEWIDRLALDIAESVKRARATMRPCHVGVARRDVFGVARNRSHTAFLQNPGAADWGAAGFPAQGAPGGLYAQRRDIDPRLTAIVARPLPGEGGDPSLFAFYGCHATALGPTQATYHRDWPGYAVDEIEDRQGAVVAAIGLAAAGDITPLPPGAEEGPVQGEGLASTVGDTLGAAASEFLDALPLDGTPLSLEVQPGAWVPEADSWDVGWPILYGAEDGRTELFAAFLDEGMVADGPAPTDPLGAAQWPKRSALAMLQRLLRPGLAPSPWHPVHRLRLGRHLFFSAPGELSAFAAFEVERDLLATLGAGGDIESASAIGYAGDYAGYVTTPAEYELQHYEGAHTLYGRDTLARYTSALALGAPFPAPGATRSTPAAETPPSSLGPRVISSSNAHIAIAWIAGHAAANSAGASTTLHVDGAAHGGVVAAAPLEDAEQQALFVARFSSVSEAALSAATLDVEGPGLAAATAVART